MRVIDTVSGLVQMSGRFRKPESEVPYAPGGGPLGQLETRLAGVVVAALKEAFDRDRARMDLERSQMDAERQRAEQALHAELRRQAADRVLGRLRIVAVMAFAMLMLSAALGVWMPGMRALVPRALLGSGWMLGIASVGCAFAAWQRVSAWGAGVRAAGDLGNPGALSDTPEAGVAAAALWLLLASLAVTLASLLSAL